jgi:hypothetical protein
MLNQKDIIDVQIRVYQAVLPDDVLFRGKKKKLTKREKLACGRAIWYLFQKGYGLSSAVSRASGSFGCSPSMIERAVKPLFPENYFVELEKNKNRVLLRKTER